ncbi:MAG TPA: 3-hydroxyacyl-CoA dehydrogenase NAD-binding domain-containing protein [Steroidobacteraceae bacterium]|nr:3-hydroxyacyl-CoA dehydrogenase NAD-binding domain-containing protein [Steroidobacteraceae bacterium]
MTDPATCRMVVDTEKIGWLVLDKPGSSANTLGRQVLEDLTTQLSILETQSLRGLVIRSGKSSGFVAGADVHEFARLPSEGAALELVELGQSVCRRIEALPYPTLAALHGFALGGGLEVALACRYRIGVRDARLALGLPEVRLGIHPGFGGTVRSVKLLGVRAAMNLMLTGRTLRAAQALELGLVDQLVDSVGELEQAARKLIARKPPPRRPPLAERLLSWPLVRSFVKPALLRQVARNARRDHYPAPYAIVELWSQHGARGSAAYRAEARSIASLFHSENARNLIRVFLLQERLKALASADAPPVKHVHVVGAGVMGGDIAAWCALRGLDVTLQDRESRLVEPALHRAQALFAKRVDDADERSATAARLKADVEGRGVPDADLIIEAIFEDLSAKQALYADVESAMRPDALLASNTSSLTLEALAGDLRDPGHLVGLHFFNPVPQMPLVEVVHSTTTRPEAVQRALGFVRTIDKLALPCRSSPGFLVNRVLFPYLHEAMHAAGEGIAFEIIDRAATEFGMPVGPIELADVVGLDVVLHIGDIVTRELHQEPPAFVVKVRELVAAGHLGRKSGRGFYPWRDGKVVRASGTAGSVPADLADRLILALVNECVIALREGIVADADLADAGVIFGTGFPPFRGGPLCYARSRGIDDCVTRLKGLSQRYGARFQPDTGWDALKIGA